MEKYMKLWIRLFCGISIFFCATNNSSAIVRHHLRDDSEYKKLAVNFDNIIKIETDNSFGSGVILNNNTIITSAHNTRYKNNIKIIYKNQEIIPIKIIYNKYKDAVILKTKEKLGQQTSLYTGEYSDRVFIAVGYGYTGTGLTGCDFNLRDFNRRAGYLRCTSFKKDFYECLFSENDNELPMGCAAGGDSGGGVFFKNDESWMLAGLITYVTGEDGDLKGDSTYGDRTAFIPINSLEEWIIENL